jgi:putative ABC transport system permease protein
MSLLRLARLRLRALLARDAVDREIDEELRFHIEMQAEANERAGMLPAEARRQAILLFGGVEGHRERARGVQGLGLMGGRASWLDVKLGLRMLVKHPGLTVVGGIAIMVAVGIAAAFFEFSEDMMNPALPIAERDRVVAIRLWNVAEAAPERQILRDLADWREEVRSIRDLGAVMSVERTLLTDDGGSEIVESAQTTAAAFRIGGVAPLLGRPLMESDEAEGAPRVAVIGHGVWQRLFDGRPDAIGRTVRVGPTTATVVGVMPEGFAFPIEEEIWTPLQGDFRGFERRAGPPVTAFGRLAPGATLDDARAELAAIGRRMALDHPETHQHLRPEVVRLQDVVGNPGMRMAMYGLRVFFILLMIVMCTNVATLVFARTATREGEIAIRGALGASRGRILVQMFLESLTLTGIASLLGLFAAWAGLRWGMDLFFQIQEQRTPVWWDHGLSLATIAFVVLLAIVGAVVLGVLPALKVTGPRLQPTLSRLSAGGSPLRFGGLWTALVVFQVAIAVAFLPFIVLNSRDVLRASAVESVFPADQYLTGRIVREWEEPPIGMDPAARAEFFAGSARIFSEVKRRIASEPGVEGVAFADRVAAMNHPYESVEVWGEAGVRADALPESIARTLRADPDYFEMVGAPIVSGRGFQPSDFLPGSSSILVNERFVADVLGGRDPVGQRIRHPGRPGRESERWYDVVGVVANPRMDSFAAGSHRAVYHPLRLEQATAVQMFARAGPTAAAMAPRLHSLIHEADPGLRVRAVETVAEHWAPSHRGERMLALIMVLVGMITLMLSAAGIHALMAFTVSQRVREIGIRTALGASPSRIIAVVFSRALGQLGLGVLLGGTAAILANREEIVADGPAVLFLVGAIILAVGMIACVLPAARVLRIRPIQALKAGNT